MATIEEKAKAIQTSSNVNDLLFPVRIEPTKDLFGMAANSDYSHAVIGTIDGEDTILNVCSDRYELIPNSEIFPAIESELNAHSAKFSVKYENRHNAVFNASYVLEDDTFAVGTGNDQIKPRFEVTHSYNGLQKYSIVLGYYRLICSNGLIIPVEGKEETNLMITGKHTQKILESIGELFDMIPRFMEKNGDFVKRFEVLYDTKVENYGERVEAVMNAVGIKKGSDDVMAVIRTEMAQLGMTTANDWLVYNGINSLIFDNSKNVKSASVRRELDKKVLAEIMK